eukprot:TRINITY_DN12129_c0_g1_i1.p1 TRINITY_DN12129_c0_g1~~TRINITY_DN12129_c0_g1_i1.p1  ORF type:complete len:116 (-),score=15.33 TRINITY_DN12129_c0_g1_i1:68-415(-)
MLCAHVGTRGKMEGKSCRNKANVGQFCVKHKKKERQPLAHDEVFGQEAKAALAPKAEQPKHKYSFRSTLNSQKDISKMSTGETALQEDGVLKLTHTGNYKMDLDQIRGVIGCSRV